MQAARIKFTQAFMDELSNRVQRITGGEFDMESAQDPAKGTVYTDVHRSLSWHGPKGARQAAAYYSGAAMAWLHVTETPPNGDDGEFLLAVQVACARYGTNITRADRRVFEEWATQGSERARKIVEARA